MSVQDTDPEQKSKMCSKCFIQILKQLWQAQNSLVATTPSETCKSLLTKTRTYATLYVLVCREHECEPEKMASSKSLDKHLELTSSCDRTSRAGHVAVRNLDTSPDLAQG